MTRARQAIPWHDLRRTHTRLQLSLFLGVLTAFQTSDVAITSQRLRRSVLLHSLLAFVFNTGVLALALNLALGKLVFALAALGGAASLSDALGALLREMPEASPALVYAWNPDAAAAWVQMLRASVEGAGAATGRLVEIAVCPHPAGRPICWCRPPLPAMVLAFAYRHRIDLRISTLFGASPTDGAMARALGIRHSLRA